ncbi:MAG: aminotransferase class I/II-fold pyridoxal phosphate-dependent enzyme [Candidatus Marinimicrobia bacterium]|jgi:aspartate/methionine/tyrosine aminotransferase|nr:aminotransferase class I/II-fold pyridoxal phosphate-dependent enzyme [Candidatus Neomarinimicrobiota bacterium]MDP6853161.1 aminotransferase class I/II-fold pyridoxal phosphate-dependent enzyme [Candidatus Neomarinimicrobiota bacterium]MDP6936795.1 aminotransferase class I/II-fold pyridoxal phosphate-dependent enzyme [Candidatus Neomarinimicrobiota bacterium]
MNTFASRLGNLGTETAFAVSQDAAMFAAEGNKMYPFHLGDMDLKTPANIMDAATRAMQDGKTGYNPSAGLPLLRDAIAQVEGRARNLSLAVENVVIQPGGKPVISKFIQALMNAGDGVLYPNPGYPIYESQINYYGGNALPYGYLPVENGFVIDREAVEAQITDTTKLLIYNNYQNPIGAESDMDEMEWLAELAQKHDLWVLSDEAYFHIRYEGESESIAALPGMKDRTVILYTFSKTYGMTGWRLGAAIGPAHLMQVFAKLNVNDESCTNHFIQYGGIEALTGDQSGAEYILRELKRRRDVLALQLNSIEGVDCTIPDSTFYLFPDVTELYHRMEADSYEDFRSRVLRETGVSFCTREHFGTPLENEDRKYIRFAYSGITVDELTEGLEKLKAYWKSFEIGELV